MMKCLIPCLLACAILPAHAGRPMTVEDATILNPGQCQLESYLQHTSALREFWVAPGCNAGGNWELAAGVAAASVHTHTPQVGRLQAKTVLQPLDPGGWSVGLVLADQFSSGQGADGDLSANVPLSFSLRGDRVLLHLNAGVVRPRLTRRTEATWGLGAEFKLNERHSLTAEAYGQQRAGSRYQFGYAHALIPNRLQIDATWGQRLARRASESMITLGLVLQTD